MNKKRIYELEEITTHSDGDYIVVDNASYEQAKKISLSNFKEDFIITLNVTTDDDGNVSITDASATFEEIKAAYDEGKNIKLTGVINGYSLEVPLICISEDDVCFSYTMEVDNVSVMCTAINQWNIITERLFSSRDVVSEIHDGSCIEDATSSRAVVDYVTEKSEELKLRDERLKYYGNPNIVPSDLSHFYFEPIDIEDATKGAAFNPLIQGAVGKVVVPYECSITDLNDVTTEYFVRRVSFESWSSFETSDTVLVEVVLPNTITSIGEYCFYNCENLETVVVPDSVIEIGEHCFEGCPKVTIVCAEGSIVDKYAQKNGINVEYTNEVTKQFVLDNGGSYDDTELKLRDERLKYYGDPNIVPSDESLFEFTILDETNKTASVKAKNPPSLGEYSTTIVIPYKCEINEDEYLVTEIGRYAFGEGWGVDYIIPNSITHIGYLAFYQCDATRYDIPESVTSIAESAFSIMIYNQTYINIPSNVVTIGIDAISNEYKDLITIICAEGSAADKYAQENGINVEYTNEVTKGYVDTKETTENKTTILSADSTDEQYPSAKAVVEYVAENGSEVLSDFIITAKMYYNDDSSMGISDVSSTLDDILNAKQLKKNIILKCTNDDDSSVIEVPLVSTKNNELMFMSYYTDFINSEYQEVIKIICHDNNWNGYRMRFYTKEKIDTINRDGVGQKTKDGGEIFNTHIGDDSVLNQALSKNSTSHGENTIAGSKGFKIIEEFENNIPEGETGNITVKLSKVDGLEVDDACTIRVAVEESEEVYIDSIDSVNNIVTLRGVTSSAKYETDADDPETHTVENYIIIHGKPDLGDIDVGHNAFASGYNSYAQTRESFVAGRDNKVVGQYGTAFGRQNTAGYASLACGRKNVVGNNSFGFGLENKTYAPYSFIGGVKNITTAESWRSFNFGNNNTLDSYMGVIFGATNTMNRSSERADQVGKDVIGGFIFGHGNTVTHHFSMALGAGNKNHAEATMLIGVDNSTEVNGGNYGIAVGTNNILKGNRSAAFGYGLNTSASEQFVVGKHNEADINAVFILGQGSESNPLNIMTVSKEGNGYFGGTVEADAIILRSSTEGSTKKFKLTIDDNGTLSATEI